MTKWKFTITSMCENRTSVWEYEAPDRKTAQLIGFGYAFEASWTLDDSHSKLEEVQEPPMEPSNILVWDLDQFIRRYVPADKRTEFATRVNQKHTWGDSELVCISGYDVHAHLEYVGASTYPEWLVEHLNELFDITNVRDYYEEDENVVSAGDSET